VRFTGPLNEPLGHNPFYPKRREGWDAVQEGHEKTKHDRVKKKKTARELGGHRCKHVVHHSELKGNSAGERERGNRPDLRAAKQNKRRKGQGGTEMHWGDAVSG